MSGTTSDSTCHASTPPGEVSDFTMVGDAERVSTEAVMGLSLESRGGQAAGFCR